MTVPPTRVFLDSNIILLLVVGRVDVELIGKHDRTKAFTVEGYHRLCGVLSKASALVTPNTLTEASNLLGQHGEPVRSKLFQMLRNLIMESEEKEVSSKVASRDEKNFLRLGLTDVVLLEAISPEAPLITVDRELWGIANKKKGEGSAINFTHLLFSEV